MGLGGIRQETRGCFILRSDFVSASDPLEQIGVPQMELAIVWLKPQRLFHVWRGLIELGLGHQGNSKIHMRFRSRRIETKRDFILFFRLLPSVLFLQRHAVIKMLFCAGRHIRNEPCPPLDFRHI